MSFPTYGTAKEQIRWLVRDAERNADNSAIVLMNFGMAIEILAARLPDEE